MFNHRKSSYILIIANLVPLIGVIYFKWDLSLIMPMYWFENVIIGVYNIKKMLRAEAVSDNDPNFSVNGAPASSVPKVELAVFFAMHYGIFTIVHGIFVFVMFAGGFSFLDFLIGAASLSISHGLSHRINFIGNEEYKIYSPSKLFWQPYKRVFILHLTVIFGAWVILGLEDQFIPLLIFTLLKILIDLFFHKLEHRVLGK